MVSFDFLFTWRIVDSFGEWGEQYELGGDEGVEWGARSAGILI